MAELTPIVAVGEAVAGESAKVRKDLEGLIRNLNKSTFDVGELLNRVRKNGYHSAWGFNTFAEYVSTLEMKPRKAQYLVRIVDVMEQVGVSREKYEPLGIARLREITSLDPNDTWVNPLTKEEMPMKDFILDFIEQGDEVSIDSLKQHVRTLKGFVGENDLVWDNHIYKRSVLDNVIYPARALARNRIGSVGKDEDGNYKDASDAACEEVIHVEFLNDPANHVLPDSIGEL